MKKNLLQLSIVLILSGLALSAYAMPEAGLPSADLLDTILDRFSSTASGWSSRMITYASWLFWSLTLISMAWTYGFLALKNADLQEFLAETMRFFMVTGFFYWILINAPSLSKAIIDSLRQIASDASGLSRVVSPSSIVDIGFDIADKVIDQSSIWSPATTTVGLIVAVIILIVLALVGINMLLVLISAWFISYGGIFLLGFGGGRWTQDIAIQYYKTILAIAVELFAMILIVGIGRSFIDQFYALMHSTLAFKELLVMLVVSIILLTLIDKIPPKLAAIVSGGGSGGGGIGLGAGMAAGAMATSALSAGASMAVQGAGGLLGGASALKAAFQAAHQASGGASGGGLGSASKLVSGMASNLGQGMAEMAKEKMGDIKEAIQDRIEDSVGGKIASAINEKMESNKSNFNMSNESEEGSLSSGTPSDAMNDEVDEFVNKSQQVRD